MISYSTTIVMIVFEDMMGVLQEMDIHCGPLKFLLQIIRDIIDNQATTQSPRRRPPGI